MEAAEAHVAIQRNLLLLGDAQLLLQIELDVVRRGDLAAAAMGRKMTMMRMMMTMGMRNRMVMMRMIKRSDRGRWSKSKGVKAWGGGETEFFQRRERGIAQTRDPNFDLCYRCMVICKYCAAAASLPTAGAAAAISHQPLAMSN